ncbi:MAG: sialate O-acetylesterase [Verrucomicrobiales bacterium]
MRFFHSLIAFGCLASFASAADKPLKVFVLAGDENFLRTGSIDGMARGPGEKKIDQAAAAAKPGILLNVMKENPRFSFLKNDDGQWRTRSDVALYDAHQLSNNTRDPARLLGVPVDSADPRGFGVGAELMFGETVGEATEAPVLLIRFATKHEIWFRRGSRSLGYDFLSPTGGGGLDLDGGWDVIHFNHGVWDQQTIDYKTGKRFNNGQGSIRIPIEEYEKNLRTIVARLKQTKASLIWASTTPILEDTPPGYAGGAMVDKYNEVAAKIMNENGVIIVDLNAECRRMGKPKALDVHDVGDLSPKVTEFVLEALKNRQNPSRPLPRVLFIGDSITGSYWEKVKKKLDGKAFVAKNPGNGEHSGTGARMVDSWVDFKQYLLNGQEYLELVDSIKTALADVDRYCPPFSGHRPELAGFVWFQGIADAQSPAFAAAYQNNLSALISDLRKEFSNPNLPFVVAALGQHGEKMNADQRQVYDAQLAAGKSIPGVATIEAIPFFFPKKESPGGREWDFYENAESFLLIGEAMGKAMLDLTK